MDAGDRAELRALRARAYGPDADIETDPAAAARLRQLERPSGSGGDDGRPAAIAPGRSDAAASPAVAAACTPPPEAARPVPASAPPAGSDGPIAEADGPEPGLATPSGGRRRSRWRVPILWLASVALAVLVTAWVSTSFAPPRPIAPGAQLATTLGRDDAVTLPTFLEEGAGTGIHGFEEYAGLTPFVVDAQQTQQGVQTCLVLVSTTGLPGTVSTFDGTVAPGCAAAPFVPQVSIPVGDDSPDALRQAVAVGTALEFVLVGDEVQVWRADPAATATPAAVPTPFRGSCAECTSSG